MTTRERPLSPHLELYVIQKPQFTMALSMTHRITGVLLFFGLIIIAWWLLAVVAGPEAYATAQQVLGSWFGRLVLLGWSFCLFYHLCNGIRHLVWDTGRGMETQQITRSGIAMLGISIGLTLLTWILAYASRGGPT